MKSMSERLAFIKGKKMCANISNADHYSAEGPEPAQQFSRAVAAPSASLPNSVLIPAFISTVPACEPPCLSLSH